MIRKSLAVLLAAWFCSSAYAAPLEVKNASFETTAEDGFAAGSWTNTLVDWSGPPTATDAFIEYIDGFSADGTNHVGIQNNEEVSQDLGITLQPNTTYNLTVGVGRRNASFTVDGNESRYGLYVGADAGDGGTLLSEGLYNAFPLSDSEFVDQSLSYTTGDSVPDGNLFISLRSTGPGRAHFDNVRLEAVPEPASIGLALLGMLGLMAIRRR